MDILRTSHPQLYFYKFSNQFSTGASACSSWITAVIQWHVLTFDLLVIMHHCWFLSAAATQGELPDAGHRQGEEALLESDEGRGRGGDVVRVRRDTSEMVG